MFWCVMVADPAIVSVAPFHNCLRISVMSRIPALQLSEMNAEQRRFHDDIVAGPRGGMGGPFQAWIHSPEFADRAQKLGEYCRFNSVLEPRLSELAILITARKWTAQFEWFAHEPMALKAGLSAVVIADIRERRHQVSARPMGPPSMPFARNCMAKTGFPMPPMAKPRRNWVNRALSIWWACWATMFWLP